MSEYWKSTPKYWCKHCSTFVRDTKIEKSNHEATPKHQGNLKRFLRDLHRGHEKDAKDKERAKSEVARLNGLVASGSSATSASSPGLPSGKGPAPSISKSQATAAQRKQQLAQLADMGVSIPDEFRGDMAMAGDWQITSQRIINEDDGEKRPEALALGVRKRAPEEDDDALETKKQRWGSSHKMHPIADVDNELDALLSNVTRKGKGPAVKKESHDDIALVLEGPDAKEKVSTDVPESIESSLKPDSVKREPPDEDLALPAEISHSNEGVKQEGEESSATPGVLFKKRKAKNIRQK